MVCRQLVHCCQQLGACWTQAETTRVDAETEGTDAPGRHTENLAWDQRIVVLHHPSPKNKTPPRNDGYLEMKSHGYGSIPMKIPFLVGWTSINPSYFDVNYRGTRFWHTATYWPYSPSGVDFLNGGYRVAPTSHDLATELWWLSMTFQHSEDYWLLPVW